MEAFSALGGIGILCALILFFMMPEKYEIISIP